MGVATYTFTVQVSGKSILWNLYDVGGARGQRHTWVPYFDDANAIIFLAPVSAFDQVSPTFTALLHSLHHSLGSKCAAMFEHFINPDRFLGLELSLQAVSGLPYVPQLCQAGHVAYKHTDSAHRIVRDLLSRICDCDPRSPRMRCVGYHVPFGARRSLQWSLPGASPTKTNAGTR